MSFCFICIFSKHRLMCIRNSDLTWRVQTICIYYYYKFLSSISYFGFYLSFFFFFFLMLLYFCFAIYPRFPQLVLLPSPVWWVSFLAGLTHTTLCLNTPPLRDIIALIHLSIARAYHCIEDSIFKVSFGFWVSVFVVLLQMILIFLVLALPA